MELARPRGTQDLLPPKADRMLGLCEEAHRLAQLYGYRYTETPTFEQTELFSRTSGDTSDVVTKEMYTFEDKRGRSLTLRPEGTAGVVRAYLERAQELPTPFKGYYIETFFRRDRPQSGRLREFRQFGIEVIGDEGPGSDVEVIAVGDVYLRGRGLTDLNLRLNSIGDETCRPGYRKLLIEYLEPHVDELDDDCRVRLHSNPMRVLDCKVDGGKDFVLAAPLVSDHLCAACEEAFGAVRAGLQDSAIEFEHDPRLVRGLDYYTRTAFEFVSGSLSSANATVCGGGRYDGLAELLGGNPTPGIGFGLGLDRVLLAMEAERVSLPPPRPAHCFVIAATASTWEPSMRLLGELRSQGISATHSFAIKTLRAQLKMADRADADFVAILGEREIAADAVTLRRLADGEQRTVPSGEVVRWLRTPEDWSRE
jgi:histidyl-tRNA synthetase